MGATRAAAGVAAAVVASSVSWPARVAAPDLVAAPDCRPPLPRPPPSASRVSGLGLEALTPVALRLSDGTDEAASGTELRPGDEPPGDEPSAWLSRVPGRRSDVVSVPGVG